MRIDFVAQLVEQLTLNQWVEGSSPSEVTVNHSSMLEAPRISEELFLAYEEQPRLSLRGSFSFFVKSF